MSNILSSLLGWLEDRATGTSPSGGGDCPCPTCGEPFAGVVEGTDITCCANPACPDGAWNLDPSSRDLDLDGGGESL